MRRKLITNVFTETGTKVYRLPVPKDAHFIPDFAAYAALCRRVRENIESGNIVFATVAEKGGTAAAIVKSCLGNGLGFAFAAGDLFTECYGDLLVSLKDASAFPEAVYVGETAGEGFACGKVSVSFAEAEQAFGGALASVFTNAAPAQGDVPCCDFAAKAKTVHIGAKAAKPRVFIPAFPGTNCELDTARKFRLAGAEPEIIVVRNRSAQDIEESVQAIAAAISRANIVAFPGGFSGGDEPDGSGKFIATTFRNPRIADELEKLLKVRDGLALGICNGFQALVKLGLVPYGEIRPLVSESPTLTYNNIARHVSRLVNIRVASVKSPWLSACSVGDVFSVPVSHGEGKFVAPADALENLRKNGQVATQYCDLSGAPTMQYPFNPNGSVWAIEGITSPDGRVLGKMGHTERTGENLYKNCPPVLDMKLFESGVRYFK